MTVTISHCIQFDSPQNLFTAICPKFQLEEIRNNFPFEEVSRSFLYANYNIFFPPQNK